MKIFKMFTLSLIACSLINITNAVLGFGGIEYQNNTIMLITFVNYFMLLDLGCKDGVK